MSAGRLHRDRRSKHRDKTAWSATVNTLLMDSLKWDNWARDLALRWKTRLHRSSLEDLLHGWSRRQLPTHTCQEAHCWTRGHCSCWEASFPDFLEGLVTLFSTFTTWLTCVVMVWNKPSDSRTEYWLPFIDLQSRDSYPALLLQQNHHPSSYRKPVMIWVFCTLLSSIWIHSKLPLLFQHLHSIPLLMYHHHLSPVNIQLHGHSPILCHFKNVPLHMLLHI